MPRKMAPRRYHVAVRRIAIAVVSACTFDPQIVATSGDAAGACPASFTPITNGPAASRYELHPGELMTFDSARRACSQGGAAHLVIVDDAAEASALAAVFPHDA